MLTFQKECGGDVYNVGKQYHLLGKMERQKKLITATLIYISVITEFNPFPAAIREKAKMNTIIKATPPQY